MNTWYDKGFEDISQMLETNLDHGLSSEEARDRLQEYGENSLKEGKEISVFELFLNQFRDVLVIILLLAALISGLLGEITDTVVISIILLLNASLGVAQEYRAEKSLAALKVMTAPEAIVLRDGRQQKIEAAGLVPGDIVLLEAGNYIPADLRLFSVSDLKIEESVLTGESVS
ncbi:MAG TPA: cation-transporting P-type ATPase, partial [Halanaerobiales bacterium]|nr:cation-transporting P-type ATPase [Halanaerobiales bacterium]